MSEIDHTFAVLAFRDSPYLEECIKSLKKQTIPSKILLCTSLLTDNIRGLSEKYDIPVRINEEGDGSAASNWSFSYNICDTKYVTLAHDDDIYLPAYTEECLRVISKVDKSLLVFTDYDDMFEGKIIKTNIKKLVKKLLILPFLFKKEINSSFVRRLVLSFGNPIRCPTVMYNKENIGRIEFSKKFTFVIDWDMWIRLAERRGSFIYVDKKLLLYRIHKGSETFANIKNKRTKLEERMIFEELWPKPIANILSALYSTGVEKISKEL